MNKEMSPWEVFLGSEPMMIFSYTCDAMGGRALKLRAMMEDAKSASEFVAKYESDPIYVDPDDPDNKSTYPFVSIINACTLIEQEEMVRQCTLALSDDDELNRAQLSFELRKESVEKMKHLLEELQC